ncbi:12667_t:CDS:2, partial [Racocetra fulgida]
MLHIKVGDKELELVNVKTGKPESDMRKQKPDHNRLACGAKDAFEDFTSRKIIKQFDYNELAKFFSINIKEKAEEELKKERERRERAEVIAEGIKEAYNNLFRDYERCKDALADWERRFTTE